MNTIAFKPLILASLLLAAPAMTLADPPSWAHNGGHHGNQKEYRNGHDRGRDNGGNHHWHHNDRHHERRVVHVKPLAVNWYQHAYVGQRLPVEIDNHNYRLPRHARIHHLNSGVTELVVADQIIRILDATQTIIAVSR
ncbi:hypothetical protein A11A3_02557 [Alcanivorax hongdengensis A-11-3]|uniref:Integral membrane protein n=1 Tax=Alcanivorax hongdengensis A-11-3 TaxID=1177179 RepID=L0WG73_9GAMM|nr:hypothetical protein [Alcanivorax hongdengensis]EKF75714.1 hypothetical protein A11A3_02557 [Alcanivorax hongdengensis A-11-3]